MTNTITTPVHPEPVQPTPAKRKRRWLRPLAVALLLGLLVSSVVYGLGQHGKAADLTDDLAGSQTSLKGTQGQLADTKDELATAQSDLSDAEATVEACAAVTTAASELWDSSESLIAALGTVIDQDYDTTEIDEATDNIDAVNSLIEDGGFDGITDFLESCGDSETIT